MPATYNLSDAFISYSRRDGEFVKRLDELLKKHNREVWVDWEDIPLTADWWEEIKAGIEGANTLIFIITPDSVQSQICYDEVEHAVSNNKRLIPVLHRDIVDDSLKGKMHPAISTHNWIFFRDTDHFEEASTRLLSALESDLEHVRMHTRFLVRAREWDARGRDRSFLLSGVEVHEAEAWITTAGSKEPRPTELHTDYILASRSAQNQRQRRLLLGVTTALVVALALSVLSFVLFQSSQQNLLTAQERGTQVAQQALTSDANANLAATNAAEALLRSTQAAQQAAIAQDNAATATIAQGQAQIEADRASTQAAAAQTSAFAEANARATSNINEQIAQTQAAIAAIAQGQAIREADRAGTQAAIAQNNAATATIAQGQAQIEADRASTQAAVARSAAAAEANARATSSVNEQVAQTQAALAALAQNQALREADRAGTQAAIAQNNAATATVAQGQALREADRASTQAAIAQNNAATATIAQGQALREANNAATQAAIAQNNAATATIAQGQALREANNAATQAAIAQDSAATATVAQGRAQWQAATAEARGTQVAVKAATATVAQGQAQIEANNAATQAAIAQAREREARAQALAVRAEQALNFGDTNIALALALESAALNPNLLQTQSILNRTAAYSPVLVVGDVQRGVFSLDGSSLLVLNHAQDTLSLWDIARREQRFEIRGHNEVINDFAFSRDGRQIITASQDGRVGMWNAADGSLIRYLDDHGTPVNRVVIHPDGQRFITAGTNGVIFLRSLSDGTKLAELKTTTPDTFDQIDFNQDGRFLYAWSATPPIVLSRWDVERGILLPRQSQRFVYFARSGQFRVGDEGGTLVLHATDGDGVILRLPNDIADVIDFTPDGRGLLVRTRTGGRFDADQRIALIDRSSGAILRTFSGSGVSERDASSGQLIFTVRNTIGGKIQDAQFAADNHTVLSVLDDNRVVMWDVRDGRQIRQIGVSDLQLTNGGMTRDTRYALTIAEDGTARVLDMTGLQSTAIADPRERRSTIQQMINARRDSGGIYGEFYTVNWSGLTSPDGRYWLSNYDVFNLALNNLQTGTTDVLENTLDNENSSIRLFTPDSRYVISAYRSGQFRIWDVQAREWKWNWLQADDAANLEEILFTSNPEEFVAFYDQTAIRWNIATGRESQRYTVPDTTTVLSHTGLEEDPRFYSWFFSEPQNQTASDGQQIVRMMFRQTDNRAQMLMWDTDTGQLLRQTDLMEETAADQRFGARFNPDGSAYVRVGLVDNSIEMFNTRTGEKTRRFFGHSDVVNGVGFSPDGQRLLSSAQNGELLLWDVTTGQLVRTLETGGLIQHQASTSTNIIFAPDGSAAAYPTGANFSLDMPVIRIETLADAVAWVAANRQLPVLTCAEREQYNVLPLCDGTGETAIPTPTSATTPSPVPAQTATLAPTATLVPSPTPLPVGFIQSAANVNLRSGPGQDFRVTGAVAPGTIVEIIAESRGWTRIRLRDNTEGWVIDDVIRR